MYVMTVLTRQCLSCKSNAKCWGHAHSVWFIFPTTYGLIANCEVSNSLRTSLYQRAVFRVHCVLSAVSAGNGVPQRSSLGPLLFSLYMAQLLEVFRSDLPPYADDMHTHPHFSSNNDLVANVDLPERCTTIRAYPLLLDANVLAFSLLAAA